MAERITLEQKILDAALARAEETGWGALRLHDVAARLGLPLSEVRAVYRDKDAIADAWFARADAAMLAAPSKGFAPLAPPERLHRVIMTWLDALAEHRRLSGEMIAEKMWPFHPHHNIGLVLATSRTVQWIREAARLDATGRRKQTEEIGLTALFLATVAFWLNDTSAHQGRTRAWLERRLAGADRLMAILWPRTARAAPTTPAPPAGPAPKKKRPRKKATRRSRAGPRKSS